MRVAVDFGTGPTPLDVADGRLVELRAATHLPAIRDVSSAVAHALDSPREFPRLSQAIVPGDHVAIVLEEGIPRAEDVLAPLVEYLVDTGIQLRDILIVDVPRRGDAPNGLTADKLPPGIRCTRHDPHDRNRLSYLASTKAGSRIYLNRDVVDADLVVLVGRVGFDPVLEYGGTSSSVFPGLADADAQRQFRQVSLPLTAKSRTAARHQADEVAWLLGVQFAIQVVVGIGSEVVDVLAGQWSVVQREAQQVLDRYWHRAARERVDLVVAMISGAPDGQGFEDLGAALDSASDLVRDGGGIVVLSSIAAAPGTAVRSAQLLQDPIKTLEHVRRHAAPDAICAWQIARVCQRARVYLMSRLADELVEDLAMTPVAAVGEVERLISRANSCAILSDAHLTRVAVEAGDAQSAS